MKQSRRFFQMSILLWLLLAYSPFVFGKTLSHEEKQHLFSEATELFREGNGLTATDSQRAENAYHKAAMRFEHLLQDGSVKNGKLYYNLGNTYFLLKDLGRAILNYRRAEHYLPHDSNLRQNLEFAISQRHDQIEEKPQTRILKIFLFWHYDLSQEVRAIIFAVSFITFWLGVTIRLFSHKVFPRWILGCFGVAAILFFSSLLTDSMLQRHNPSGVITAREILARKGDGTNYQQSFKEPLHAGTEFNLIVQRNGWAYIELHNGRQCWIPVNAEKLLW